MTSWFNNVKCKRKTLQRTEKNIARTKKNTQLLKEASILKAKEIPLLRQPKTTKNEKVIPFTTKSNSNNPNVFAIIKQSFDIFQYSKSNAQRIAEDETY